MALSPIQRLRARPEWKFLAILPRANRFLTAVRWSLLEVRALLPVLFAVAMGPLDPRWEATKLRERPVAGSLVVALTANVVVFWCSPPTSPPARCPSTTS